MCDNLSNLCLYRRYRLSADVLRYPLPQTKPPAADEPKHAKRRNLTKESATALSATAAATTDIVKGRAEKRGGKTPPRIGSDGGGRGGEAAGGGDASEFVAAFDAALPLGMLKHLQVRRAVHNRDRSIYIFKTSI